MRIVTWNINSVRLRIDLLQKLCTEFAPDIICLQETKTEDVHFPAQAIKDLGYDYVIYSGEKSYNGVAIISKFEITDSFALEFYNDNKRHICAKIGDYEIHNFYVPAGGDEPDIEINPKFKHKLSFVQMMQQWFIGNRNTQDKIILVGDLNIAPHEHDVWSSKQLKNVVSHTSVERTALLEFQNSFDFIDTARHFTPMQEKIYTWWSYRNKDWQKSNRGRRLDHIWVSSPLELHLRNIISLDQARNWLRPSDHVPFILDMDL